ncbi:MAG TPA: hypothetical protein VGS58_01625 [Candidatus Sulfopaludibacter sp.]|nr:hypothetical protein [Candidatus Sulfopaludibacter sp.]
MALLKNGVSPRTAYANISSIAKQLEKQYPDSNKRQDASLPLLAGVIAGEIRPLLLALLAGAALLLLIANSSVASLLLVRSESRRREIDVHSGLGASRARLACQFVTEGCWRRLAAPSA